ncbi:hypothetical protein ANO11243_041010 [Dothideomycetidae sp. 11243]|nr:hypothetical protein ANO11243_041010 [fungal sp. No.11243]
MDALLGPENRLSYASFRLTPPFLIHTDHPHPAIETLLARFSALSLLLISFLSLLFSGEITALYRAADGDDAAPRMDSPCMLLPLPPPFTSWTASDEEIDATPTLAATMLYHFAAGVLFYASSGGMYLASGWLVTGGVAHLILAAGGLLLVMFGQGPGHISRRTGADKRTSGFPFKNTEAAKKRL